MRSALLVSAALVLSACGSTDDSDGSEIAPEPSPSAEGPTAAEPPAPLPGPAMAEDTPATPEGEPPESPSDEGDAPALSTRAGSAMEWGAVELIAPHHPNLEVRRLLWSALRGAAREVARAELYAMRCEVESLGRRMYTVGCAGTIVTDRGIDTPLQRRWMYEADDAGLEPVPAASLWTSLAAFNAVAIARCEADEEMTEDYRAYCDSQSMHDLSFTSRGVRALFHTGDDATVVPLLIPYAALREVLRRGSVLTRAVPELAAEAAPWAPTETPNGATFGPSRTLGDALQRWADLPEEVQAGVGVVGLSPGLFRLAVSSTEAALITRVAHAVGAPGDAVRLPSAVVAPQWAEVRAGLNVRPFPIDEQHPMDPLGGMPAGTLALTWPSDELGDGPEPRRWRRVGLSPDLDGVSAARVLRASPACVPSAQAFIESLPEERRATARRTLWRGVSTLRRRRAPAAAAWFAAATRRNHVRFAVHALEEGCVVGERWAHGHTLGELREIAFTSVEPRGQTLIALGTHLRGESHWQLFGPADREAAWSHAVPSPHGLLAPAQAPWDQGDEWSPLAVGERQVRIAEGQLSDVERQGRAP